MTKAACPEAKLDDDPADIRRLATGLAVASPSPARQEEEVVWSWLILKGEGSVDRVQHLPQSEAGAFSNRGFG
jgi:hypothetical protein